MLASFFSRNQTGGNSTIWELPSCTPCLLEEKGEAGGFIVLLKKETHTPHLCFIVRTNHVRINIIINIALFHSTLAGAPSMNGGQSPKVSILGERARQRDTERKRDRDRRQEGSPAQTLPQFQGWRVPWRGKGSRFRYISSFGD